MKTAAKEEWDFTSNNIGTNATARIHLDKDVSEIVKIERGVRQGDTLSPKMFTSAM